MGNNHYVFVYGTLKKGYGNHVLLKDSEFIGEAISKFGNYVMRTAAFPFVTETDDSYQYRAHILGEIYSVNDDTLKDLDLLEGHPTFYERQRKVFKILGTDEEIEAWIYLHPNTSYPLCPMDHVDGRACYYWDPQSDELDKIREIYRAA